MLWLARWRRKDLMQISAQHCECGIRRGVTFTSSADLFCFQFIKVPKQFFFFSWQSWWKCHPGIFSFLIFITEYIKSSSGLFIFLIFKNSSVQKTLRQTASTIYCHRHLWSGSDFAAVTFTAAEMGLKFTRIWANLQQIPSRLSLHLVLSEARGLGVGARGLRGDRRGSQAAAEILIASLGFSLDPITLSGPGRRPVSLGSGYSTHTQKHTLTAHTPRRGLNITRRHVQMETETYSINVRPRTRALIRASVSILASPLMVLTAKQQWGSVLVCSSGSLLAFTPGFCSTVSCGGNKKKNLLGLKW